MSKKDPPKAVNVHLVSNNTSKITRRDILEWIASVCNIHLKRVEDLANGSIYCKIMEKLFPGSIQMNRVRTTTKFDSEALANYKLLSNAFRQHEVKMDVPMHSLVKGKFSDNFRFAQWFKLFYEANKSARVCDRERQPGIGYQYPRRSNSVSGREVSFLYPESHRMEEPLYRRPPSGLGNVVSHYNSAPRTDGVVNNQSYRASTINPVSDSNASGISIRETGKPVGHEEDIYVEPSELSDAESYEFPSPVKRDTALAGDSVNDLSEANVQAYQEHKSHVKCLESNSLNGENVGLVDHQNNRKAESPAPYSKRRIGSERRHGTSGVQLPPPSPSLSNAQSQGVHRSNRRPATATPWNPTNHCTNLLAAGDRPNVCTTNQTASDTEAVASCHTSVSVNSGQRLPSDGSYQNHSAAADASSHHSRSYRIGEQKPGVVSSPKKTSKSAPVENSSNTGTISRNQSPQFNAVNQKANRNVQKPETSGCPGQKQQLHQKQCEQQQQQKQQPVFESEPLKPKNYPPDSSEFVDSAPMTEAMLHRELAMLRFETMGQRKSLYYCQKEAQFYFKKLRQIEDLCLHLNEMKEKPQDGIIDAIFGILYETEEGFASPAEAEACV